MSCAWIFVGVCPFESPADCIYIVIFFFAKCDFASVTLFTRLLLPTWQSCHKSIQLCCCKVLKFCFICIFFQEPLDLRRRSSGVLKVCLNSSKRLFLHTMRNIHDFLEIWVDKESWGGASSMPRLGSNRPVQDTLEKYLDIVIFSKII